MVAIINDTMRSKHFRVQHLIDGKKISHVITHNKKERETDALSLSFLYNAKLCHNNVLFKAMTDSKAKEESHVHAQDCFNTYVSKYPRCCKSSKYSSRHWLLLCIRIA